jgi:hypothetical protein
MALPHSFKIEGFQRWALLASPWIFLGFMCLSIALPFIPEDRPRDSTFMRWFSLITAIGWGVAAGYSLRVVKRLPLTAFTADEEGLWPTALPRDSSLVRWADIAAVRERPRLQRLELLSVTGELLARLEYQLNGFERLRSIVLERSRLDRRAEIPADGVYEMSPWHHALSMGGMLAFAALGWYVAEFQPLVGYGTVPVVGMIAWEYWTTPYRVRADRKGLVVSLPVRTRFIPRHLISGIDLADDFANQMRHPHVVVKLREPERPVLLKRFRQPPVELARALQAWQRGDA